MCDLFEPKRLFTPAEARQTLPLVRQIVADLLNISLDIDFMKTVLGADAKDHPQILDRIATMQELFTELESIGCFFKDWSFKIGLVDFPAIIDDKLVFLCWRSDESDLEFYHEIDAGFAGRKPIPQKYFDLPLDVQKINND
ncbi:MAG: DUF2203 domain-containing protein [Calditrichia bacterium]|nr:DUF2203 domain-containing protein [Calditrichota bacterium]MCB0267341.1 DUF2203 domain-containing protein [Calditrichota bacterium]MCB9069410.1 DUF2203 domain-containing protein [Calditrichia bacterium]